MGSAALNRRNAVVSLTLIAAAGLLLWGDALGLPFLYDDWTILARVQFARFWDLLSTHDLPWGWYRPWSRELHFWALLWTAGETPLAFHLANLALWIAVLWLYLLLARRAAGDAAAATATAGVATLSMWSGAMMWGAGAQELWMLLFALLFLHAFARDSRWAALALAGALLSKETAAVLPLIAVAWAFAIDRETWLGALRRLAPSLGVTGLWAALHPTFLPRLLKLSSAGDVAQVERMAPLDKLAGALLSLVNLHPFPAPDGAAWGLMVAPLFAVAVLITLVTIGTNAESAPAPSHEVEPSRGSGIRFGLAWAAFGAAPFLVPSVDWQPYYGLLAASGVWLALGAVLASSRAALAVIAVVGALGAFQHATPSDGYTAPYAMRRAAEMGGRLRAELLRVRPDVPPRSRLWFAYVPTGIGLGHDWFSRAFEVWYRDSTVRGAFYSAYWPRDARGGTGTVSGGAVQQALFHDYFFRYDSLARGWIEVSPGEPDSTARADNVRWREDHRELASLFARAEEWQRAAAEYERLFAAYPESVSFAMDAAVSYEVAGDSASAARAYRTVLGHPGAGAADREFARRHGHW